MSSASTSLSATAPTVPDLSRLRPNAVDDLVRIGRDRDGGYVVPSRVLTTTDVLVGLGVETDWSFEADFLARSSAKSLVAVDGTVHRRKFAGRVVSSAFDFAVRVVRRNWGSAGAAFAIGKENLTILRDFTRFFGRRNHHFVSRMLMGSTGPNAITWGELRDHHWTQDGKRQRVFVKMDIEGSEYDVLPFLDDNSDEILCLIVEFHDLDSRAEDFHRCIERLSRAFCIVHVHGNNCAPLIGATAVPTVLELTFLNRSQMTAAEQVTHSARSYPLADLDRPNHTPYKDYPLQF